MRTAKVVLAMPPGGKGGFSQWWATVLVWLVGLFVVYSITLLLVDVFLDWSPEAQYCASVGRTYPCKRSDLIAFQFTATIMQYFMGLMGIFGWHTRKFSDLNTPQARVFARLHHAELLCAGAFTYQVWDFIVSMTHPEHCVPEFLVHHVLAAATAYLAIDYQMLHYYALFFGGCSEVSSMFLVWVDLDKFFPQKLWPTFVLINQVLFVLVFFIYRVVGWPWQSIPLWKDVLSAQQTARVYRPGKDWFLKVFLFMNVALGALQIYWFAFGIFPKVMQVLSPTEDQ